MTLTTIFRSSVLLLGCAAGLAGAQTQGGTHLQGDYPMVSCGDKPARPDRPAAFSNNDEIDAYNQQVEEYNQRMEAYIDCVQRYVDTATNDLKLIKQRIQDAIDQANP